MFELKKKPISILVLILPSLPVLYLAKKPKTELFLFIFQKKIPFLRKYLLDFLNHCLNRHFHTTQKNLRRYYLQPNFDGSQMLNIGNLKILSSKTEPNYLQATGWFSSIKFLTDNFSPVKTCSIKSSKVRILESATS